MPEGSPVLGRPSLAAAESPALPDFADASSAAFRADGGDGPWVAVRAASVTGIRHRLAGQPGEDSFAWAADDGRLAVAVADGLGSLTGSAGAAARATGAAVHRLDRTVEEAVAAAAAAATGGGATTLVVGIVSADGTVQLARIGDSTAFVVRDQGESWSEVFPPPDDDGITTVTPALPADVEPERATATLGEGDVLVLATDGVADPWRDGPTTVAPALARAVADRPSPLELTQLANFSRQGCHDDRTMAVVWLVGG